jgi:hypothetical protein
MKEAQTKKQLSRILKSFTIGGVLHLLSELFDESAKRAQAASDETAQIRAKEVTAALCVLGLGVDAVCTQSRYLP